MFTKSAAAPKARSKRPPETGKSPGFPGFFAGFFDKHSERGFLQIKAAAGVEHGIVLLLMPDYLLPDNVFDKRGILCKNSV